MKKELDELLCKKYPEIFKDRHGDIRQTAMCWGFDVGDGWFELIDTLCYKLMWDGRNFKNKFKRENPPVAVQVKEKFGTLRFYVDGATDEDDAVIRFAELLSGKICETCGTMKDVFQTSGWIKTTCAQCDPETYKEKLETDAEDN